MPPICASQAMCDILEYVKANASGDPLAQKLLVEYNTSVGLGNTMPPTPKNSPCDARRKNSLNSPSPFPWEMSESTEQTQNVQTTDSVAVKCFGPSKSSIKPSTKTLMINTDDEDKVQNSPYGRILTPFFDNRDNKTKGANEFSFNGNWVNNITAIDERISRMSEIMRTPIDEMEIELPHDSGESFIVSVCVESTPRTFPDTVTNLLQTSVKEKFFENDLADTPVSRNGAQESVFIQSKDIILPSPDDTVSKKVPGEIHLSTDTEDNDMKLSTNSIVHPLSCSHPTYCTIPNDSGGMPQKEEVSDPEEVLSTSEEHANSHIIKVESNSDDSTDVTQTLSDRIFEEHAEMESCDNLSSYETNSEHHGKHVSGISVMKPLEEIKESVSKPQSTPKRYLFQLLENDIYKVFSRYGEVRKVIVLPPSNWKALVHFKNKTDANRAVEDLNGRFLPGIDGLLRVSTYTDDRSSNPSSSLSSGMDEVGDFTFRSPELVQEFKPRGKLFPGVTTEVSSNTTPENVISRILSRLDNPKISDSRLLVPVPPTPSLSTSRCRGSFFKPLDVSEDTDEENHQPNETDISDALNFIHKRRPVDGLLNEYTGDIPNARDVTNTGIKFPKEFPGNVFSTTPSTVNTPSLVSNRTFAQAQNGANNFFEENDMRKYTCRFDIGVENDREFQVARRIIGLKGVNMKHVVNVSNAKLRLRGRGSGYLEGVTHAESQEPLHLCVSCVGKRGYDIAVLQVKSLLEQLYKDYGDFLVRRNNLSTPPRPLQIKMKEQILSHGSVSTHPNIHSGTLW